VSKIQDGGQLSGSSNVSETTTHIIKIPTATTVFGVNHSCNGTSDFVGRRRVLEIQDGSQLTGSSNIFETMTYIIKIPTANLRHSTVANSQEVYLGDSNNERQSEMAAETGNTYIS